MEQTPTLRSARAVRNHDWTNYDLSAWDIGRSEPQPGVHVWTSWLPVAGYYETIVTGDDVPPSLLVLGGTYTTREDAQDGHARILRHVERVLLERAS